MLWMLPAAASAQTGAVPPPIRSEMQPRPASTGAAPPPASPLQDAARAAKKVNSATSNIYRLSSLAAPTEEVAKELASQGKLFRYKGYALTAADAGIDVANGQYMRAEEKVTAAVIDRCIDVGVRAACLAVSAPSGELAAAPCIAAVSAVKFCAETYFGGSAGTGIVQGAKAGADWIGNQISDMRDSFEASRLQQQSQFQATNSGNAQAAMSAQPANGGYSSGDDGSAQMMASIMGGIGVIAAANSQPPIPYAAQPAPAAAPAPAAPATPTGCHAGHDEAAHPGGCHSAPKGRMN